MEKMYLLLRNNKQSGPFSLNELVNLDLKSLDLIWEEGKSKSWAYPSEIRELKDFVKEEKKDRDSISVYPQTNKELVLPKINPNHEPGKQDGIHVDVYVKLPERYKAGPSNPEKNNRQQVAFIPANEANEEGSKDPGYEVLNKKYVRDLDDIKEEYSKWIGKQKENPLQPVKRKFIRIWTVCIILIVFAFVTERWNAAEAVSNKDVKADSDRSEKKQTKAGGLKAQKNKKQAAASIQETGKNKKAITESPVSSRNTKSQNKKETVKEKTSAEAKPIIEKEHLNVDTLSQ
jgi:hypothetical protein